MGKYKVIYVDPPWQYKDAAKDGSRGAGFKYPLMNMRDLMRMPVEQLADDEFCVMFMWWVSPMPLEAIKLVEAWGFRLSTMKGFTWGKTYKHKTEKFALGMGHVTRSNSEDCLIAIRGKLPERLDASVCQMVVAPRLEHSAKPPIFRELIEKIYGDVPKIELFARGVIPGWDTWGNECPCSVDMNQASVVFHESPQKDDKQIDFVDGGDDG
ncbi:DNA methyltransferase [Vibrio phage douglas 12A4]|uniref:DNA methyltransferase n=1 Tax=Vibrio phage douglas 12A4 TaxID=573171 RepID=UPI0002C08B00|nr:DNA methyltransferase [Vibrio phage douglas 12A4]AGG58095.1 adenine methylase [Vibrio phage douglas 12A4]